MGYVDPASIHDPTSGSVAPAAWGDAVNAAVNWLANPDQVKVARSANQLIPSGVLTEVRWNAEEWDSNGLHSLVSGTEYVTVKTPGKYLVLAAVIFAAELSGADKRAELWKGHPSMGVKLHEASLANVGASRLNLHAEVALDVGDTISVHVIQAAAGSVDLLGGSAGLSARSWMSVRWIGA